MHTVKIHTFERHTHTHLDQHTQDRLHQPRTKPRHRTNEANDTTSTHIQVHTPPKPISTLSMHISLQVTKPTQIRMIVQKTNLPDQDTQPPHDYTNNHHDNCNTKRTDNTQQKATSPNAHQETLQNTQVPPNLNLQDCRIHKQTRNITAYLHRRRHTPLTVTTEQRHPRQVNSRPRLHTQKLRTPAHRYTCNINRTDNSQQTATSPNEAPQNTQVPLNLHPHDCRIHKQPTITIAYLHRGRQTPMFGTAEPRNPRQAKSRPRLHT